MTLPIEVYTIIGDCETAISVGRDGRLMLFRPAVMSRKHVIAAVAAPFLVCLILVPLLLATAQPDVAAGINGQTLKAAAELKTIERKWAALGLFHTLLRGRE